MACKQNKQNICTSKAKLLVAEFELVIAGLSLHRHAAKFELVIAGFSLHRHAAPLCMAHFFVLASAGLQLLHPFRISFVFLGLLILGASIILGIFFLFLIHQLLTCFDLALVLETRDGQKQVALHLHI